MQSNFDKYLKNIKFEKNLNKLKKVLKGKKVVLYGAGSLFTFVKEKYDFSFLDVLGISDQKFYYLDDNECLGYKTIIPSNIVDLNPDYIVVTTQEYSDIIDDFKDDELRGTKIKILPMFKKTFLEKLQEYFTIE